MADRFLVSKATLPGDLSALETASKRVKRDVELYKQKLAAIKAKATSQKAAKKALVERTVAYEAEYKAAQKSVVDQKRTARAEGTFFKEADPKVIFAIRLKGVNKLAPKPKKILQLFRLRQLQNGVFMKINSATQQMIKIVEPLIAYGYPSLKAIRSLIYKRGYAKINGQRIPITSNEMVAEHLGKFGIQGVEDLVHEIYTCGPAFKQASNFLWPFKLDTPRGGFIAKRHGYVEARGGDWGNRAEKINSLISRMN
eukprot:GDKJ01025142.1.p1 GENE.GDKJ01025142.1~~GDKJ01025142.1.p1  ORF type:complete len:255 (-),score=76.06 GDKJ01025142.1:119-883(-)